MTPRSAGLIAGFGLSVLAAAAQSAPAPVLEVSPAEGPTNAPLNVIVRGVPPGAHVTVTTDRISEIGRTWTASAEFTAGRLGIVNSVKDPSIGGTYRGVSPHGLYCSVLPEKGESPEKFVAAFFAQPNQSMSIISPMTRSPITVSAAIDGREIGSATIGRGFAIGTDGQEVSGPSGWRGLYYPPAAGTSIGEPVVVLTGSGGGVASSTAALLASNGHPALALAIYNYKDLPKALLNRPLEHIQEGAVWLARKSGTARAAVMGISRGSEAAQLAAAFFPEAFSGVIAEVPSHLIGGALGPGTTPGDPAWSVGGRPLQPFPAKIDLAKITEAIKTPPGYRGSSDLLTIWNDPAVEATNGIPYERLKVPLLVLAGGSDDIWPSNISAERIRRRMEALSESGRVEIHVYPDAGHQLVSVGRGNALSNLSYSSSLKGYMSTGGTPNGNCEASFDAFNDMLKFLDRLKQVWQ